MRNQLAVTPGLLSEKQTVVQYRKEETNTQHTLAHVPELAPLYVRYRPVSRFLEAVWQRPVTSTEYRQGIRFLGLCVALLRAKYLLIDFSDMGDPSQEEQQSSYNFLQKAFRDTTLLRSARVLARTEAQQQAHEAVRKDVPVLPYEVDAFYSVASAKEWLFRPPYKRQQQPEASILIPMHCSLKDIKKYAVAETVLPKVHTGYRPEEPKQLTYCRTDFVEIAVDRANGFMKFNWLKPPTTRQYCYGVLKGGRAVLQYGIERLLVQNQRLGTLTLENQTWLVATTVNFLTKSRIKLMAVVTSPDVMQQMASETIKSRIGAANLPFRSKHFLSDAEAMGWLQSPDNE